MAFMERSDGHPPRRESLITILWIKVRAATPSHDTKCVWVCPATGLDYCTGESMDRHYGVRCMVSHLLVVYGTAKFALAIFAVYVLFCESFQVILFSLRRCLQVALDYFTPRKCPKAVNLKSSTQQARFSPSQFSFGVCYSQIRL